MPSKFLVPLEVPDFQGTPLSTADAGYVLLFIKYGWLTSQLPDGTQVDLVLQRPLDGFTEVDRYANPVTAADTVLGAIEKIQRSLSTLKLQGDVTGTAAYVGGELIIQTTGGGGIDCTELLNCQVIIDLDGRITALESAPAIAITTTDITNWNTAYSWGDHSTAGYLLSEADTLDSVTTRGNSTNNNILIGTTVDAGYKLDVNGWIRFGQDPTSGQIEFYPDAGSTGTYSVFKSRLGSGVGPIVAFYGDVSGSYKGYSLYGPDVFYDGLLLYREAGGPYAESILLGVDKIVMPNTQILAWSSTGLTYQTVDVALARNAANVLEINSGTAGSFAKLKLKNAIVNDLVGVGTRMVVADATGELSVQSIPTSNPGTVTSIAIATGTTGTDINVSGSPITSSGTITLNIPDASATARGVVTTGTQTIAGQKTFNSLTTIFDSAFTGTFIEGRASGVLYGGIVFSLFMQFNAYPAATQGFVWKNGAGSNVMALEQTGVLTVQNLAGTGTRMVVASNAGVLSTQAIPSGTITSVALAVGTTGSDVNVSGSPLTGSGGTITLNIPDASLNNRGVMTTGTQAFNGAKTFISPHSITVSNATLANAFVSSFISTVYIPSASVSNRDLYGERNSMTFQLGANTLSGTDSFNVSAQHNEVFISGGAGSTQPFRALITTLAGQSGQAAMNIADFRYMEIKSPDSAGITGHTVTTAFGLYINDIRNAPNFSFTDTYAIFQAGANDIVLFSGSLQLPNLASPSDTAFLLTDTAGGVQSQRVSWDYILSINSAPLTDNRIVDGGLFNLSFDQMGKFGVNSIDQFLQLNSIDSAGNTISSLTLYADGSATFSSNDNLNGFSVAIEFIPTELRLQTPKVTSGVATAGHVLKLVNATTGEVEFAAGGGGGISLTDLSATAPLQYNNTTGVFSITQASGSTNGFLSAGDWSTFNGKQASSANLTSLSALTFVSTSFVRMTGPNTFALDTNTYITGNQTITLSGDISGSGATAITTTIGANKVTNAMLAQVATSSFLGRITAGTGNVETLTATQATSLLNVFTSVVKGLAPASGGGTTNFLRADGTWAVPVGTITNSITFNNAGGGAASGSTFNGSAAVTISFNTIGALSAANPAYTGTLTTGTLTYTASNVVASLQSSVNAFNQLILQNSNAGATASSGIIVNNDLSTDTTYYGDYGMNSSGFTGSGSFNLPNAVYLASATGDLVLGTYTSNAIRFVINSGTTDAFRIGTTGNLMVNQASDAGYRFDVNGTARIQSNLLLGVGTATNAPLTMTLTSAVLKTNSAAGDLEVDSLGNIYFSHAASSRGVLNPFQIISLTAAYTLVSQTAAQRIFNIGPNGAVTVQSGITYYFECFYSLSAMSATTGSFGFALGGTATFTSLGWHSFGYKTGTITTATTSQSTYNTTTANTTLVTANTSTVGQMKIVGIVRVNAGGTIIPQVSLGVAAAAVVGVNSYFRISPIGSGTFTTIGNWT